MTEEAIVRNTLIALDDTCLVCAGRHPLSLGPHGSVDYTRLCDEHLLVMYKQDDFVAGCPGCDPLGKELKRRNL